MAGGSDEAPSFGKTQISLRVVIEGLGVAAIMWLATTVNQSSLNIARLQVQISQMQISLTDVPLLVRGMAQVQIEQSEHERRLVDLEKGNSK